MNGTTSREIILCKYAEFGNTRFGGPKLSGSRGVAGHVGGSVIVTDVLTNRVDVYRHDNGTYRHRFELMSNKGTLDKHLRHPMDVAVDSSGKYLVVNNSPYVRVYSQTGTFEERFNTLLPTDFWETQVNLQCITSTTDGRILYVGDNKRMLVTIHNSNYALVGTINVGIQPVYISSDDHHSRIAVSDDLANKVCVFDVETGEKVFSFHTDHVRGVAYHKSSDSLFVATGTGCVEQYCCKSGVQVGRPFQDLFRPYGICLTQGEKLVVSDKNAIKVFDVKYP